jgi:hypothetical protein
MSWRVTYRDSLRADLDIAGPELFQRAGDAVRAFVERGEGKAYPVDVDSSVWTFFVPGGRVLVFADLDADELAVLRILPDRPLPALVPLLDVPEDDDSDD